MTDIDLSPGPAPEPPAKRPAERSRWFEPRLRPAGMLAFMLHRSTGLGLTLYLWLHLAVLNLLRGGPQEWDRFLELVRSPVVWILDAVLLFGLLFHALNGVRVALLGLNLAPDRQRQAVWLILIVSLSLTLLGVGLVMRQAGG